MISLIPCLTANVDISYRAIEKTAKARKTLLSPLPDGVVHVLEAEARKQATEAVIAATDDGRRLSTENVENRMTSSQHAFLPYDVTSGK